MIRVAGALVIVAVLMATTGACGGGGGDNVSPSPVATAVVTASPAPDGPAGVIAIGHSGINGENADPAAPNRPALQYSWATGTDPVVKSIYQRLLALHPEWDGLVANRGQSGASADTLGIQAQAAFATVPSPAVVLVQTLDNDIACDGTDAVHVPEVGASIEQALRYITQQAPEARIIMLTQLGRPATYASAVAANPLAREAAMTSSGACSLFDEAGNVDDEGIAELTAIIESYEGEQARVCAMFAQCSIADVRGFHERPELFSSDLGHLAPAGLRLAADAVWPYVADALGIRE